MVISTFDGVVISSFGGVVISSFGRLVIRTLVVSGTGDVISTGSPHTPTAQESRQFFNM